MRKGDCFRENEKYSSNPVCKNKELNVMILEGDEEVGRAPLGDLNPDAEVKFKCGAY